MLNAISDIKKKKEEKRSKLVAGIKLAESLVGIGLEDARTSNILMLPKTSTHSTNLSSGESTTTSLAFLSTWGGSRTTKNNKNNPLTLTQDQLKSINDFF